MLVGRLRRVEERREHPQVQGYGAVGGSGHHGDMARPGQQTVIEEPRRRAVSKPDRDVGPVTLGQQPVDVPRRRYAVGVLGVHQL